MAWYFNKMLARENKLRHAVNKRNIIMRIKQARSCTQVSQSIINNEAGYIENKT